jgi:hypothetical protein
VLILRDALSLSAKEVSELLGTTVASVNSGLQRARKAVDERVSEKSGQSTMSSLDERGGEIVQKFVDAFERGDVDAIIRWLAEDATFGTSPLRQRSVNARLAPRAEKVPPKTRRIQGATRGREMTWLRIAAAKYT